MLPDRLVTTYLEMNTPADFKPSYADDPTITVMQAQVPLVPFYRFLYRTVGETWYWSDRDRWSDEQLAQWLSSPNVAVHVLYSNGTPAGYIELEKQGDDTEISYFGLFPAFFGKGYGKHLLSHGIQQAWAAGAKRVWVHTCNLDAPQALPNYQRRGMKIYHVDEQPMPQHIVALYQARQRP